MRLSVCVCVYFAEYSFAACVHLYNMRLPCERCPIAKGCHTHTHAQLLCSSTDTLVYPSFAHTNTLTHAHMTFISTVGAHIIHDSHYIYTLYS